MDIEMSDLFGAMVNMGADPYIVDTEEQAKELLERLDNATERDIIDDDEFETAMRQLDLEGHNPERIWSFVDGSEFLVCFCGDFH